MSEAIIVAIITGLISLSGTVLTIWTTTKKQNQEFNVNQAVIQTEMRELTREVRAHNDFARRVPVLEEQMRVVNQRITELERK